MFESFLYFIEKRLMHLHCLCFQESNWRDIGQDKSGKRIYLCINCGYIKKSYKTLEQMNK